MSYFRPGLRIEFFDRVDYEKEKIRVLRSLIYDVLGKRLIVAQSVPSVLRSNITRRIIVTYLVRKDGKPARFGFPARITDLVTDYQISSGQKVPAIVIEQEGAPRSFNIRFYFRVRVPAASDLTLSIGSERATLIDVSIGGAMIGGAAVNELRQHDRIKITVGFGGHTYLLDADVLRIWSPGAGRGGKDLQYAAMKFLNTPELFENGLGKIIFKLERQLLAQHTGTR